MRQKVNLALPPGWTLHPGGPHIGLPVLKGYLELHGIDTTLFDLNIESAHALDAHISQPQVLETCQSNSVEQMNNLYFGIENVLETKAGQYNGTWKAHDGFCRDDCDLAAPESIRQCSMLSSPFTEYFRTSAIPGLLANEPDIIGFNIVVPAQLLSVFELIRLIRQAGYGGVIILGGNVISRIADDMCLDWVFDLIDGLVVWQGEITLRELCQCLETGRNWDEITNLYWRNNGVPTKNKRATLTPRDFAAPDFSDLPLDKYWGTPYLTMLGSRGCYYGKCSFCAIPYGWGPNKFIGSSPARQVYETMRLLSEKYKTTNFKFVDEAIHPKMVLDLAAIAEQEGKCFSFEAYARLDKRWTDPNFIKTCARAGLTKAYLGLELAPSEKRSLLEKSDCTDPALILKLLHDHGIKSHVFCMFGYPGTGVAEAVSTIEFAFEHARYIDTLDIFSFYFARHTTVAGITAQNSVKRSWAVEFDYAPIEDGVLWPEEVTELASTLGDAVWNQYPNWFHPIYRMYSPWHTR